MPDAVSFIVTTYRKLAKGETGFTQMGSLRVPASTAIGWILDELPDEAVKVTYPRALRRDGSDEAYSMTRITIDWLKVPDAVRHPKLPARRR